uniref:Putative homing endonuclease n=1 Tax=viral metagenome TaxID=1070528 RepID=A0A6M3L1I3_9ZZZZ
MYKLRPYQEEAVDKAMECIRGKKNGIIVAPTGCHAKGTKILMSTGHSKYVEDISVGDEICGLKGEFRKVLSLKRGKEKMYKISPLYGNSFIVNENHILSIRKLKDNRNEKPRFTVHYENITVKDYINKTKNFKHLSKLYYSSANFTKKYYEIPIDPWVLGILIGDGFLVNGINFTNCHDEIIDEVAERVKQYDITINKYNKKITKNGEISWNVSLVNSKKNRKNGNRKNENLLRTKLKALGLYGKKSRLKFVPDIYKYSNKKIRLSILAGILDTDGHLNDNKSFDYISKSERLSNDVVFLARSVGLRASINKCVKSCQNNFSATYWRVYISGNIHILPNILTYKKQKYKTKLSKNPLVTSFKVEYHGIDNYYGFELDGNHLYLTSDFMVHHNSGKSLLIANIAKNVGGKVIVLQPSREILSQNMEKMISYGETDIGVYSASLGRKDTGKITFATIGSVVKHKELFADCELIIVDEADAVNSRGGMYEEFITSLNIQTIGLTATPFRLRNYNDFRTGEHVAESRILTRTRPRIFNKIIHITQIKDLFDQKYLCPLDYDWQNEYDSRKIKSNSTGQGFNDEALKEYNKSQNITDRIVDSVVNSNSKHCLAFTQFTSESDEVVEKLKEKNISCATVSATTKNREREEIVKDFRSGKIRCLINVGIFLCGFNFPELDCIIFGRPTKSLRVFYQGIGRGIRISEGKTSCKVYDLCDNVKRFGKIETFVFEDVNGNAMWRLKSNVGYITGVDVATGKDLEKVKRKVTDTDKKQIESGDFKITFGKFKDKMISEVDTWYLKWCIENFDNGRIKKLFELEVERRKND